MKQGNVLGLINNSRRRFTLYCLLPTDYTDINTAATQIAAWEQSRPISEVGEGDVENLKISLHHNHLPKLAESNVIEYDGRSGDIVVDDGFEDIRPVLERHKKDDEVQECAGPCP